MACWKLQKVAVVETLNNKLYKLFVNQLALANIGYSLDSKQLCAMTFLIHAIDYINKGNPTSNDFYKIIQYHG